MPVTLTNRAADHVRRFLAGRELRVRVRPTGCSGYAYVVEPAEATTPDDHLFDSHGVRIAVDPTSYALLAGTEVDFVREGLNESFRFNNPNVKNTCGCGESFAV